jgi:hypothetical protein
LYATQDHIKEYNIPTYQHPPAPDDNPNPDDDDDDPDPGDDYPDLDENEIDEDEIDEDENQEGGEQEIQQELGNDELDAKLRQALYENTEKNLGGYVYSLTNIYHYNKLSKQCLGQMLASNFKFLPEPNIAPPNIYYYMKIINSVSPMGEHFEKNYYCSKPSCQRLFGTDMPNIPCPVCETVDHNVFIMNSLEQQLITMLEKRKLALFLEQRAAEQHENGIICDVTDGIMYKNLPRETYDITLITNTDGFALSKSSKLSGWPHLAIIVEVPPHLRSSYLLFNGLWIGHDKPRMFTFYRPLAETLRRLATTGFQWKHPHTNILMTSKVYAPMLSADAQGRFPIQNIVSFSCMDGGCALCELKGVRVEVGAGSATVYKQPVPPEPVPPVARTAENMIEHAQTATQDTPVHGVRGPCIMSLVPHFDCAAGFVSEYQHSFCLGIVKQLINFMKEYDQRDQGFYIGANLDAINNKLKLILTPDIINRPPRSIDELKSWKASELRHFALYYMLQVFDGDIEPKYMQALMLIVAAMYMLLKSQTTFRTISSKFYLIGGQNYWW